MAQMSPEAPALTRRSALGGFADQCLPGLRDAATGSGVLYVPTASYTVFHVARHPHPAREQETRSQGRVPQSAGQHPKVQWGQGAVPSPAFQVWAA